MDKLCEKGYLSNNVHWQCKGSEYLPVLSSSMYIWRALKDLDGICAPVYLLSTMSSSFSLSGIPSSSSSVIVRLEAIHEG